MLADYVLEHDYPHILDSHYEKRYMVLFEEITNRTAKLFAQWMSVGFAHGKRDITPFFLLVLYPSFTPVTY